MIDNKYRRYEGESPEEYEFRICSQKDQIGTWDDVADIINTTMGWEYKSDKYSKPYNAFEERYRLKLKQEIDDNEVLKAIDHKKFELRKEAQKLYDQRREYNKLAVQEGRAEHLENHLIEIVGDVVKNNPLPYCKVDDSDSDNEAILCFSDWHLGMVVDNVFNTYNVEICKQRVADVVAKAIQKIRLHGCKTLHVLLLGDVAGHGSIHASARVASEENVCDQIMLAAEIIAQAVNELANEVDSVYVYGTYGNHLRTIQNKNDSIHADNMEKLVPWWLEWRLKSRKDIVVVKSEYYEFLKLDVCGQIIVATHGDLDRLKDMPTLFNTLFTKVYGTTIDYVISADKHHIEEFEAFGIESTIVPALCGSDDYANDHRLYSKPAQKLMFFNPVDGKDAVYNLKPTI